MTEQLHSTFSLLCIGEGNGNPLQCSCLENPRDGRAWWAAIYGVTQSQTQLKRLSSSSSRTDLEIERFRFETQGLSLSSLEPDSDTKTQGQGIYLSGKGYTRWESDAEKGRQPTLLCQQASHHRDQQKLNLSGQMRKAASMLIPEVANQGRGGWGIYTPAPISSGLRTTPWGC